MKFDRLGMVQVTGTSSENGRFSVHFRVNKWHPAWWLLVAKTIVKSWL